MHRPMLLLPALLAGGGLLTAQQDPPQGATAPAPGTEAGKPREWIGETPWWTWAHATGDWGGLRNRLAEAGIEVAGGYTADCGGALHGGASRRASWSSLLDLNAAFDLEVLAGLPRTIAYVDAYSIQGGDPSDHVGDLQGVSNIQAGDRAQIAELWVETRWLDGLRLKVGKVDYNSEFAFTEVGGEFVNSSAAVSPTIVGYPTYPDPATSVNLFWYPSERCYLGGAVYDGATAEGFPTGGRGPRGFFDQAQSDAYFYALEAGTSWTGGERWGSGRMALGAFHHSGDFTTFAGNLRQGTQGVYLVVDQKLWRERPGAADDNQGFAVFGSFGLADDHVAEVGANAAVGATWIGAIDGRDFDVLGFGVMHADLSDQPAAGFAADETALELFYKLQLTPCFAVKPDLQWIHRPAGDPGLDSALVGLLRFELNF